MITLTDSIEIGTTPEKVFEWLLHLEDSYRAWHSDHVDFHWVKGKPFEEGSVVYFEEYLHGKLHKGRFLCTEVEPNRRIEYKPLFPLWILMPKGSFATEPKGEGCVFTATTSFRLGSLSSRLLKHRVEAIRRHMAEEGENLKRLLEKGAS